MSDLQELDKLLGAILRGIADELKSRRDFIEEQGLEPEYGEYIKTHPIQLSELEWEHENYVDLRRAPAPEKEGAKAPWREPEKQKARDALAGR